MIGNRAQLRKLLFVGLMENQSRSNIGMSCFSVWESAPMSILMEAKGRDRKGPDCGFVLPVLGVGFGAWMAARFAGNWWTIFLE